MMAGVIAGMFLLMNYICCDFVKKCNYCTVQQILMQHVLTSYVNQYGHNSLEAKLFFFNTKSKR